MHEGHHGILEDPKKQSKHGPHHHHHNGHPHHHEHDHDHPHDPVACSSCESPAKGRPQSDLWTKLIAGAIVGGLVIVFLVRRFF